MTILVPYRDREEHLKAFIPHMQKVLPHARIIVIEQMDNKVFNRGKLLNIGYREAPKDDYYCMHDVDMLPLQVDYTPAGTITQLASSDIQKTDYLGGVTLFHGELFGVLNGYPNDFHRGEDNALMFTIKMYGIPVINRFGKFHRLNHARPEVEFDPVAWYRAQHRDLLDGVNSCEYAVELSERCAPYLLIRAHT